MGALLSWWGAVELLGIIGLPLTVTVFANLPDRGWSLSRPLSLLLVGWMIWLPLAAFPVLPFNRLWILATTLLFAVGNALLLRRAQVRAILRRMLLRERAYLVVTEVMFTGGFALMVWERTFTPQVRDYEKYMDVAFLSAVWRAPHLPPPDPWFVGQPINYYYFGQYLMGTLAKVLGIQPGVAFNLSIALVFALAAVAILELAPASSPQRAGPARQRSPGRSWQASPQ